MSPSSKLTMGIVLIVGLLVAVAAIGVTVSAPTPTLTPTPSPTAVPTHTPSPTGTPTSTPTPTPTLTPTPTDTPTPTPTSTPTSTPTPTPTPVPTDTPTPEPAALPSPLPSPEGGPGGGGGEPTPAPDCSAGPAPPPSTIAGRRLVAFYGVPIGRGLGILGAHEVGTTLALLREQAEAYRQVDPCVEIVPVFHTVVTISDAHPGEDGNYNHHLTAETLRWWLDTAAAEGVWVVLDIQPGRSPLEAELGFVEPYLYEPNVHLAVDPEFIVGEDGVPGTNLGRIDGEAINAVQVWLNGIAEGAGQHKILVIHQFDDRMIVNKEAIQDYPLVDLVWDADGYGGPGAKRGDYNQYRAEPGFEYGGFKLFYDLDTPLMTPGQVLAMDPPPAYIVYQ
jgi:hypothetical protein